MTTTQADGRFEEGLRIRREVLGAEHVDRSLENVTDFGRPVQELVTEYCWGAVWGRPGLDRRPARPSAYGVPARCHRRGGRHRDRHDELLLTA